MSDYLKKMALIGLGITATTKEKIEELTADLIKKGELKQDEANDVVKNLFDQSQEIKDALEAKITSTIEKLNYPSRIEQLENKIKTLEEQITKLQQ